MSLRIDEILRTGGHRSAPLPTGDWQFYQEWNRAVFLHWSVEIEPLRAMLPEALDLDLFEGKAWVSVVAFTMEKVRPRGLPPFAPLSDFDEVNVRTYVKYKGKAGVYFLSIEGGKWLSCLMAKKLSPLPYRYKPMHREQGLYKVLEKSGEERMSLQYEIGEMLADKQPLDTWLTERYSLFQDAGGLIKPYDIHHVEWPVRHLSLLSFTMNYPELEALGLGVPDKLHYSAGVQVLAWKGDIMP